MAPRMLPNWIGKVAPVLTLVLVALLSLPSEAATKKAAPKGTGNPFDLLKGYWSGGGTVVPGKGNPERVSCKVTYTVAGSNVSQSMRCAGIDYKFNTSSRLTYSGGKIFGAWSETTYDASGTVSGGAIGNAVHAVINGDKYVSDSSHTINIVQLDRKPARPPTSLYTARGIFSGVRNNFGCSRTG